MNPAVSIGAIASFASHRRPEFLTANLNVNIWYLDQPEREPSAHVLVAGLQGIGFESMSDLDGLRTLLWRGRSALLLALGDEGGANE